MTFIKSTYICISVSATVPLRGGDVVRSEHVVQVVFVIQLELQLLGRPVLLLPQEEAQQRLTLQCRHVLREENNRQVEAPKTLPNQIFKKKGKKKRDLWRTVGYLAGGVGVENFILDDEPEPLPLLLVAFGPVQVAAHGGVLSVGGDLPEEAGGGLGVGAEWGGVAKYSTLAEER